MIPSSAIVLPKCDNGFGSPTHSCSNVQVSRTEDDVAVAVKIEVKAVLLNSLLHDSEIAFPCFRRAKDGTNDDPGGVIERAMQCEFSSRSCNQA